MPEGQSEVEAADYNSGPTKDSSQQGCPRRERRRQPPRLPSGSAQCLPGTSGPLDLETAGPSRTGRLLRSTATGKSRWSSNKAKSRGSGPRAILEEPIMTATLKEVGFTHQLDDVYEVQPNEVS